jgi:aryl-alcohol dehydrogenase-like predicted oxidoreductase
MEQRTLSAGLVSSALGLGCMGMSEFYGETDEAESIKVIHAAMEKGITMLDTADMYGSGHNEQLVGRAVAGKRDQVLIATKFGIVREPGEYARNINGRPEYVKAACEASLKRLGIDIIDLYYLHRKDPETSIEDTVGAMAELVKEGKVRFIGLSEVSAGTLDKAEAVHHISALQTEYSLWTRDIENGIMRACRKNGTGIVAYSPLGRGFLTGAITSADSLAENDFRRFNPRFAKENFDENAKIVAEIKAVADETGCTPAQLALAWVLAKGQDVVPIPGTKRIKYLEDNINSLNFKLSAETVTKLDKIASPERIKGLRYPEEGMKGLNA